MVKPSRLNLLLASTLLVLASSAYAEDEASSSAIPTRVVSINLCTDQLAMQLTDPSQLIAITHVASDPNTSSMVEEAKQYAVNHGLAEEVYSLQPDLILASKWTSPATVAMLKTLGVPIVQFNPANTLEEVRSNILQMGDVLGRQQQAQQLVAHYDQRLVELTQTSEVKPEAVLYYPNGYALGDKTLSGQVLKAAGFKNTAVEAGMEWGGNIPLEVLIMAQPDAIITSLLYPGGSRSEEIFLHPAIRSINSKMATNLVSDADWFCGTTHVLRALDKLIQFRQELLEN